MSRPDTTDQNSNRIWNLKITFSCIILVLALLRFILFDYIATRMDTIFLALIAASALIPLIPWERIKTIKAGGFELTLETAQVKGAIESFNLVTVDHISYEKLRELLLNLKNEIEKARGSRILWIDDHPYNLLGERRLFRSLGIEVVTASSSAMADGILEKDNDFDLIISDIQREGQGYSPSQPQNYIPPNRDGAAFVMRLRENKNPILRNMYVIFYAAYSIENMTRFTQPVSEVGPAIQLCNSLDGLLTEVFRTLSIVRSHPQLVEWKKLATGDEEPDYD